MQLTTNSENRTGASAQEWSWAALHAGPDLLPAYLGTQDTPATKRLREIAQPKAGKGPAVYPWAKVPSTLSSSGMAAGFQGWPAFNAVADDVRGWMREPDYNILIHTRNVRGLDIDVDDPVAAAALERLVFDTLGVQLPVRERPNSGRRTMLMRFEPNPYIGKRVVHTPDGLIEFSGNLNQVLWAGSHSSGARFTHRNLEAGIPVVPLERAEQLWDMLRQTYEPDAKALLITEETAGATLLRNAAQVKPDPVLDYLYEQGMVTGHQSSGVVDVRCPNEAQHTSDTGANSTSWFPAGTGGRDAGGFRCLHGHCSHLTTPKFLELIGYRDAEVDSAFSGALIEHPTVTLANVVAANAALTAGPRDLRTVQTELATVGAAILPALALEYTKNKPSKTVNNLQTLLDSKGGFVSARYDEFTTLISVQLGGRGEYLPLDDTTVSVVRLAVERTLGITYDHGEVSRQLQLAAKFNTFDSAQQWLKQRQWDGVARLGSFATDILGASSVEYGRALSCYMFVAMVARILVPGCKADISPILLSPKQGTGKSSLVEALAPFHDWFGSIDLTREDDDIYRSIKGKVVLEMPELRGLSGRDAQATKALMTQQVDSYIPKYMEHRVEIPRRCLFIGTDNRLRMLQDPTGNRRWAPIRVAETMQFVNWPAYIEHRDQYWAEALELIKAQPSAEAAVELYSTALRKAAAPFVEAATVLDAWYPASATFVRLQPPGTAITLQALYAHITGEGIGRLDYTRVNRLRGVMTALRLDEIEPDVWLKPNIPHVL